MLLSRFLFLSASLSPLQKTDFVQTFGPYMDSMKDLVQRCSTIEIAVFRDLFLQAFPDIFKDGPGINAALVSPPDADSSEPASQIPPERAIENGSDIVDVQKAMSAEELTAAVSDRIPFSDDIELHDIFREPRADEVVETFLKKLPEGITCSTNSNEYVNHVVTTLFTKMYRDDHCIPVRDNDFTESIIPVVPKGALSFLHNLAVHNANDYTGEFDIEMFWRMVRHTFAVPLYASPATKPTATDLMMQGRVVVATEDMLAKLRKTHDRDDYNEIVAELLEGQSPRTLAADPNVADLPMDRPLNITRLHLKARSVEQSGQKSGVITRKRVMETETVVEKNTKKAKK